MSPNRKIIKAVERAFPGETVHWMPTSNPKAAILFVGERYVFLDLDDQGVSDRVMIESIIEHIRNAEQ